ncbi:putative ribonuclease H-like domain-containing protein, partial [Tanacetum coccineum]
MECVLHYFVAENEQDQDMIYEDFDQVDQLEMEEMDLKWQMAMLSLRINRFEKKAGRKMNYNNQQPARFDRRKVRCYKCLQLGHFARECNVKTVDDKARYSAFKVTEVKSDEPKALVSVDSMVNWSDHTAENKTGEVEKVYGMMAGLHADSADASDAAAEFAMMGISPKVQNCPLGCDSKINDLNHMYNNLDRLYNDCYIKVQAYQHAVKTLESQKDWYHKTQIALEEKIRVLSANLENTTNTLSYTEKLHDQAQKEKKEWEVKFEATLARFEKWKESSKNLKNLIDSSMSTRTKVGLGFQEYFGVDEVFDLSTPSVFYSDPVEKEVKPLYSTFVKAGEMHAVPPPITGTYMPSPYQSDIEETQVSYGSKSDNNISDTISESNDFVSCDNSDKSSDSETHASCDSSLKTQTKDIPPAVDIQTLPESDVEDPNSTTGSPSFSCSENVKSPRIICNKSGMNNRNVCKNNSVRVKKCFVCGSKLHLIKDCDFYTCIVSVPYKSKAASVPAGSRNSSASVTADGSDPAVSRNRPAVNSADRPKPTEKIGQPTGWSKRVSAGRPVSAGRSVSAGCLNPAARPYFRPSFVHFNTNWPNVYDPMIKGRRDTAGDPSTDNDIGIVDSGCSRSMTGNKEKLDDFVQVKGGIVKFGGGDGRISGKGTIKTSKLDFENVYYVEELQHFNLFSVSQICDKKNKVLFTDTDCLVLSEEFQLPDESQVVLRIPREHDLYTFHISDLQPEQKVTCLVAKASLDESTRWHRRMAHVNFKTINKLAKGGLVDGLPLKVFTNEHNCVACNKGKQHKASYKHISAVRLITETLQLLHMDLFGPTNIRSIDQKYYSLVVTDDFSRFSWTFFLGTKDETFYVLKEFIALIENQLNKKVKGIRCDNGTEFKNAKLIELCGEKGIKRDYSNPRTPQQNGVAERKNRTLIEAARTMLADSKLPTMFWTEAVCTACYVLNRVSITNPHNKTPYELISGKVPQISHLKPFGCQVTILNTSDYLGKFEGKADEGYLVGYASNSKAYRVYNLSNKRVEETLNLRFLEDKPNAQGIGHEWYFDLDYLTDSLGYTRFKTDTPAGTQETNIPAGTQAQDSDSDVEEQVIVVPSFPSNSFSGPSSSNGPSIMERNADYAEELAKLQRQEYEAKDAAARYGYLFSQATAEILCQAEAEIRNQGVSADRDSAGIGSAGGVSAGSTSAGSDPAGSIPAGHFQPADSYAPAASTSVSADLIPVHADESTLLPEQISSGIFTSSSYDDDFRATLTNLAPAVEVNPVPTKRVNTIHPQSQILGDLASPVLTRSRAQKSKFGEDYAFIDICKINKGANHTDHLHCGQNRGYQTVFGFCFLMGISGISAALRVPFSMEKLKKKCTIYRRGTIDKTLFIKKDSRDILLVQVYVDDIIFGSTNKAWCDDFEVLMKGEFEMSAMGEMTFLLSLQNCQTTPDEAAKNQMKDETDPPINVQVLTPTDFSSECIKKIFQCNLKGQPKLGLWYPKDSPFQLEAYSDSDYAGSHGDRKSTTGGCQFLGRRLISWQCKKQNYCALSSLSAEYVAAASCCTEVVNTAARCTFFLLTGLVSAGRTMVLLVVILSAGRLVSAGRTMVLLVVILSAGRLVSAGRTMVLLVVILSAGRLVSAGRTMILLVVILPAGCFVSAVVYAANTSIHAAGLVCAGGIMFLLADLFLLVVTCFCCAQLDIAGWLVYATSHLVSAAFGPEPRPAGYVDPDVFEPIIFGPQPRPSDFVDPDLEEPVIFGPQPRPDNYIEPADIDNLISMEEDTIHGGFHEESPVGPNDAPTPTADAAGRAEDPTLLTSLSAKLDRCMGRIDSLETELGSSKKIMGGAILTLVSQVKKLERTVKRLKTACFGGDAPATEGDENIQDAVDLEGLSRIASEALGHNQPAVLSEHMEEREEEEVPLRHKRSVYRCARTEFHTSAFAQFHAPLSTDVLPPTDISKSAGPSAGADKGKAPMPDLEIPAEFLAEDAQARQRLEEEQASARLVQQLQAKDLAQADVPLVSEQRAKELDELLLRMTDTDWLTLMMQVGTNPALARELLGADVNEDNFIERMTAIKERKKRALADLRYRALKGKPLKHSEVTQMMRNLVKNQWCAAHNGTITMKAVKAMSKQQLIEEYENICRCLEKDRLLSAQYNLFRPKPAITEPPSKRQRVERASSQPSNVPAATTQPADD